MSFWGNNTTAHEDDLKKFTPTKKLANDLWLDEKNELMMIYPRYAIFLRTLEHFHVLLCTLLSNGCFLLIHLTSGKAKHAFI